MFVCTDFISGIRILPSKKKSFLLDHVAQVQEHAQPTFDLGKAKEKKD